MRDYRFSGTWTVPAAPEAVAALLVDLERYPSWWREIRAVASLGEDDALSSAVRGCPTRWIST